MTDSPLRKPGASSRLIVWAGLALLMVAPVLAMRLAQGGWGDPGDFVFLAVLFLGAGGAFELAARAPARLAYPIAGCLVIAAALLQTWLNLAVGVVGSENNPVNLLFVAVPAIVIIGAAIARFRPLGLSRVMIAAAFTQGLIFAVVLALGLGFTGPLTVLFVTCWLAASALFRKAAFGSAGGMTRV